MNWTADIAQNLKDIRAAYERALTEQADIAHREIIQPFCKKWGVTFGAGMGSWSFYAPSTCEREPGSPIEPEQFTAPGQDTEEDRRYLNFGLPDAFWSEFKDVVDVLDAMGTASGHDYFVAGYFTDCQ